MNDTNNTPARHRGIYLIPNLFTIAGLFAGFYAIVAAANNQFQAAAIAIFISMLLDSLDGRVARLTHTQTEFGAQMDSLSDMVCFGLSPALVMYSWSLSSLGKIGWLAAFFYAVCAALRLARFNAQSQSSNKRHFQGLATPAAAGLVASLIWLGRKYGIVGSDVAMFMLVIMIIVGLLQVSAIRYRSFKDLDLRGRVPFIWILVVVLVLILISFDPPHTLFFIFLLYALSGPLTTLWRIRRYRRSKRHRADKP